MKMEEDILFPAIKEALKNISEQVSATIRSEIERMNGEHEFAGGAMDKINETSMHFNKGTMEHDYSSSKYRTQMLLIVDVLPPLREPYKVKIKNKHMKHP
jgi:hypothetical protein